MVLVPCQLLSLPTADTSLVTEQLQAAVDSSPYLSLQKYELLTGHQWHVQALDILSSVLFNGLTASTISRKKKKIPALPGALSHLFLPADTM